jgi:hypothetical protein
MPDMGCLPHIGSYTYIHFIPKYYVYSAAINRSAEVSEEDP